MYKKIMILLLIALSVVTLIAAEQKSARKAMLMSLAVPGTGQMYMGNNTKAGVFLGADLLAIGSYMRFEKDKNDAIENFMAFANVHADLRKGVSDDIYLLAQAYRSSDEYNRSIEQSYRNYYFAGMLDWDRMEQLISENMISPEDSWDWETDAHFRKYYAIRKDKQSYEIYQNFALGAIMLNRLISALDAMIFSNKINKENKLYSVPDTDGRGLRLIYEYKF